MLHLPGHSAPGTVDWPRRNSARDMVDPGEDTSSHHLGLNHRSIPAISSGPPSAHRPTLAGEASRQQSGCTRASSRTTDLTLWRRRMTARASPRPTSATPSPPVSPRPVPSEQPRYSSPCGALTCRFFVPRRVGTVLWQVTEGTFQSRSLPRRRSVVIASVRQEAFGTTWRSVADASAGWSTGIHADSAGHGASTHVCVLSRPTRQSPPAYRS